MLDTKKTFDLEEVMAYAVMVHDNMGYKSPGYIDNNRDELNYYLNVMPCPRYRTDIYKYENVPDEDDREKAAAIVKHYRRLLLTLFKNHANDFEIKLLKMVQSGTVTCKDFGVIAAVPKAYDRELNTLKWKEESKKLAQTSQHIGTPKSFVTVRGTIRKKSFISSLYIYKAEGVDEHGNLFVIFDKYLTRMTPGQNIVFNGYVERHQYHKEHGGAETVLGRIDDWTVL